MQTVVHLITKGSPFGGAQHYVYTLAENLPINRFESTVLVGQGDELPQRLETLGVRVARLLDLKRDIAPLAEVRAFITLIKTLKELRPDILHTNSSKAGLLGALAGRLARVPRIVFTGHAWASNEDRPWIIRKFFLLLHWATILLSDRTICVSKKTKNDVAGLRSVRNKTCVVYNGMSTFEMEEKYTARISLQTMFNKGDAELLWLGTIAELHRNKGLDLLIEALARITVPFQFFIIGEGEERENLEQLIKDRELEDRVFLVGKIPNAKKYLKAFDIFTLTSRTEALPYTVLEAGLAGLPVLASRVGGIPEIITNGQEGVLVRPNTEDIYQALGHLFSQTNKRTEYGIKLKAKVEKEFSLEQQISQTMKVYSGNF
jgi:glycosyltransferase involved in cell wall biosynthesis